MILGDHRNNLQIDLQERSAGSTRPAYEVVDHLRETPDPLGHGAGGRVEAERIRVHMQAAEERFEIRLGLDDVGEVMGGEKPRERTLMIVDVLTQVVVPRNDNGQFALFAGVHDRPRASRTHDGGGLRHEVPHLAPAEHHRAPRDPGRTGSAVLNEDVAIPPGSPGPVVQPVHEPVEGMVVGAHDGKDEW